MSNITPATYAYVERFIKMWCASHGITDHDECEDVRGASHDILIKADATFSKDEGVKFLTWVHKLLAQELTMRSARNADKLVPLAQKASARWRTVCRKRERLAQTLGREPTPAELAKVADMTLAEYHSLRDNCAVNEYVVPDEAIEEDIDHVLEDDWEVPDGEGGVACPSVNGSMDQLLMALDETSILLRVVDDLPTPESEVIRSLYYPPDGTPPTQAVLAEQMNMDQQRVSDIHRSAITKIRTALAGA